MVILFHSARGTDNHFSLVPVHIFFHNKAVDMARPGILKIMSVKPVEWGMLVLLEIRRQRHRDSFKFSGTLGDIVKLSFDFKQELGNVGEVT